MSETAPSADVPGPSGRVHDLGYKRYDGARRPQHTRYRTIMIHVITTAWRGFWRMKAWIGTAAITLFTLGTIMYVSEGLSSFMRGDQKLSLTDALLPMSFDFFSISAIPLTLTVLAGMIADDMRTGAFEFYFSRPIRGRDYVVGKLGGSFLLMSALLLVAPLLLTLFRIGLSGSGRIADSLGLIPRVVLVGTVASLAYATVPVAFSAISSRRRHTLGAWAAFYFIVTNLVGLVGVQTGITELVALDLSSAVGALAYAVFDVRPLGGPTLPPGWLALCSLLGYSAISVLIISWRVAAAERAGMGGG